MISTNMPCNASEATSMFQRRRIGMPDFPVTLAMIHNEPGAHPYSTQMLKDAIAFVEKSTASSTTGIISLSTQSS